MVEGQPETITLRPEELRIVFDGALDLAARMLDLSQVMTWRYRSYFHFQSNPRPPKMPPCFHSIKLFPERKRLAVLALSVLALTLIAPWAPGQDPDPSTEIRRLANQGDASAQYGLGAIYNNGEGVLEDSVVAYAWLNLAAAQGIELARENKDNLQTRITRNLIVQAQELSAALFDRIN